MQDEASGVPVRTVKSFMSKVPSVFTGKLKCHVDYPWTVSSIILYSFVKWAFGFVPTRYIIMNYN